MSSQWRQGWVDKVKVFVKQAQWSEFGCPELIQKLDTVAQASVVQDAAMGTQKADTKTPLVALGPASLAYTMVNTGLKTK